MMAPCLIDDRMLVRDLANLIVAREFFARTAAGEIFHYEKGVYAPRGEFFIRQRVKRLLLEHWKADRWNRRLAQEVVEFILLDTPELDPTPSCSLVNLENGLLDIWTGELVPHTPQHLSTIRIPICFNGEATCPHVEEFIEQMFPEDSLELAWEIIGDLLTPDRSIQKAICMVGEGGNGKGVFAELAVRFVGPNNVARFSLQRLEKDRFAAAGLYQKLANVCADLPSERLGRC
jgi:putative DNA primase/helicase